MSIKNLSKKQTQALYSFTGIIIVALICSIILLFYNSQNSKKMLEASTVYQEALITKENPNSSFNDKITKFKVITSKFPNTSFGIFASWQLADLYESPTKLDTTSFNINIANIPNAIEALKQSANANPKDSLTNITKTRLAKLYLATNKPNDAIKVLLSLQSEQNSAYPLMLLGQAYSEKGNKQAAIQTWQRALQDPNSSTEFRQVITQFINNRS